MALIYLFVLINLILTTNLNGLPIQEAPPTRPINYEEIGGYFEGDIKLPPSTRGVARRANNVRWPDGTVPYEISTEYATTERNTILSAMRAMENLTAVNNIPCITFRPRVAADNDTYIFIVNSVGCNSYIGRNTGSVLNRTVSLQHPGCIYNGIIMHELIHALGFYHEQSRPDRDTYVRINWDTIQSGSENNFEIYNNTQVNTLNTSYDYGSVMHYGRTSFSKNVSDTIVPIFNTTAVIGQRITMSPIDIEEVRLFYGCDGTGTTSTSTTSTSTSTTDTSTTTTDSSTSTSTTITGISTSTSTTDTSTITTDSSTSTSTTITGISTSTSTTDTSTTTTDSSTSASTTITGSSTSTSTTDTSTTTTDSSTSTSTTITGISTSTSTTDTSTITTDSSTSASTTITGSGTSASTTTTDSSTSTSTTDTSTTTTDSSTSASTTTTDSSTSTSTTDTSTTTITSSSTSTSTTDTSTTTTDSSTSTSTTDTSTTTTDSSTSTSTTDASTTTTIRSNTASTITSTTTSRISTTTTTTSTTKSISTSSTTPPSIIISITLTINSLRYQRIGGTSSNYFYIATQIIISVSDNYTFKSSSTFAMYCFLYTNSFNPRNPSLNLVAQGHNSAGNEMLQFTTFLSVGGTRSKQKRATSSYVLVSTTEDPSVTGKATIIVSGTSAPTIIISDNATIIITDNGNDDDSGKTAGIIAGSVVGGVLLLICLCGLCVAGICSWFYCLKGRPLRSNRGYVRDGFGIQNEISSTIFIPSTFAGFFLEDGIWHGPQNLTLSFYPQADHTLHGKGSDHLGAFVATGVYSPRTLRIAFDKRYQAGLGNAGQHSVQTATVQAAWNPSTQSFEGKSYLKAGKHREEQRYVLQKATAKYRR